MGYSPWGHKELDTTECLHFHFPEPQFQQDDEQVLPEHSVGTIRERDPEIRRL